MRPILIVAVAVLALALVPGLAGAATTANFAFKHGETNGQTGPTFSGGGVRECLGPACTYESHEFTIAPGEENGRFSVSVTWGGLPGQEGRDTQDDWDLFVYRVAADGSDGELVASSASGGTTEETAFAVAPADAPIRPATYRIYVDNFKVAPQNQNWEGFVAFEPFIAVNKRPAAALSTPERAAAGEAVTLDASRSFDPDGSIVNYAWDLDGDGDFDVDGAEATRRASFGRGGPAHVSVRVRDDRGGVDYATSTIDVSPQPTTRVVTVEPPAGSITIDVARRQSFAAVALRGVAATITCPTACRIAGRLTISRATARRLGTGRRTLARASRTIGGTRATPRLRLKPRRRTRGAMRRSRASIPAVVRVVVTARGFSPQTFTRRVTITR